MKKIKFSILLVLLACVVACSQSEITISGNVTDTDGQPLSGVTAVVKNATSGTITDIDGGYTLKVKSGDTLVFSYENYEPQTIIVDGEITTQDISMVKVTTLVKGKVTDAEGKPLIGVAIKIKDKPAGTVTDTDGNYTIKVDKGDVLTFSFIDHKTKEEKVSTDNPVLDVVMEKE